MIHPNLIHPKSILVVGGSNNIQKPGGKLVYNLINGQFDGQIAVVNPKEDHVQGVKSYRSMELAPAFDLVFLSIPAKFCLETIEFFVKKRDCKAFVVISAGFGEVTAEGKEIEEKMKKVVDEAGGSLIGPNCIGIINEHYVGVFTTPIPQLSSQGCTMISSSGSTAVFIIEKAVSVGLRFSQVFTVGNAAHTSVEDVLAHLDSLPNPTKNARIIMIYVENIANPTRFLRHAMSLIQKGCKIAAIKSGTTVAGSRAASSHTGAMISSDMAVRALFRKAGIVYCSSREELVTVASIFHYQQLAGPNIAVVTHAGGTAVLLTDALEQGGLTVPEIPEEIGQELVAYLDHGSSVKNPIDFLATGTAEQLGIILDFVEHKMDFIDGIVVVFGSPGLFNVKNVYQVLNVKMDVCKKPIYPVLPSLINAQKEISYFTSTGKINFPDEVELGIALAQIYQTVLPEGPVDPIVIDDVQIRAILSHAKNGYLSTKMVSELLKAAGLPFVKERQARTIDDLRRYVHEIGFPLVMKVVGPLHKTDIGGVILGIRNLKEAEVSMMSLMNIENAKGVLIQPVLTGIELFIGAKKEGQFGHLVLFGLGGILVELFKDIQAVLSPCRKNVILRQLKKLKGYQLLEGYRGRDGINIDYFIDYIQRVGALVAVAPEIVELDINPLIGKKDNIRIVDARIRIEK